MKARMPANLTNKEQKALYREIDKQIAEHVANLSMDLQASVLWQLHTNFGFGKKRLLKFSRAFQETLKELQEFYEMKSAEDMDFIYRYKLKNELGIDVKDLEAMFCFNVSVK